MKKSKKAALLLAVMGLNSLPVAMDNGLAGESFFGVNRAEARVLTEEERIERGLPDVSRLSLYNNLATYSNFVYNDDNTVTFTKVQGGMFSSSTYRVTGQISGYDNETVSILYNGDAIGLSSSGETCFANANGQGVGGGNNSLSLHDTSGACKKTLRTLKGYGIMGWSASSSFSDGESRTSTSYSSGNMLITVPGAGASPEETRKHMKEAGIDVEGETIKINKPMDTKDINADGKIKTTGDIEAGGNVHVHGNEIVDGGLTVKGSETVNGNSTVHGNQTVDGDSRIHGSSEIDKDQTVHGNQHINGNQEVDKDQTIHGNQTVDGDSRIHGNQVIDKDATIYGDTNMKGDAKVDGDLRVKGDTQLGDDKNKDKFDVWAKTHLHGDTTVGDDENDKFTVNATSEFKADATFDKNVKIKGDLETDGNSTTHGNATIDKDLHVKGNSETDGNALVHGNGVVEGDFEVKGSTKLGDDKNKDTLDVNAKTHLHGDTTIGDDKNDKLTINATTEFAGESSFGKDVHIKGSLETDGDSRTHGNSVTEGNAIVYGNAGVAQDLTVGGNSHVFGDSVVDGDIYGRSFNVGDERYIDKDGINANNHKIRNVADGEIGPNSLDAVNGRQLWNTREGLQHNINQVGAQTAAMANLHPMDFEYGDKFSLAAAVGGYQNQQAFALGAFVKPTQKSMVSLTGTLGMSQNMYGVGYTQKFGEKADFEHMTETQLQDELAKLDKDANEIREHDKQIKAENETLRNASRVLAESIDTNSAEIERLKVADEKMRAENVALRDENKALKGEIAELRADNKELAKNLAQNSKGDAEMSAKLAQSEEKVSFLQKAVDGLKAQLVAMAEKLGK